VALQTDEALELADDPFYDLALAREAQRRSAFGHALRDEAKD